ncbi:zinc finger BED domain-containing protein 5-like [Chanodichthys erythropterus]|uniref:zinc finger BED domain-containing protein 5-like n=1 Tax=Chanodichthys erythropterus TaxID=933992 RepID=UPI00351F254F
MAEDIVTQVVEKLKQATSFALQLDESTDISGESQLVAFVRYKDKDEIDEHILFCKPMLGKTTGEDIFNAVDSFFTEHSLDWLCCLHICTNGAASMTGRIRGFVSHVKQVHPDIKTIHCVIHREALASKRMSPKLHEVLNDAVKIINFVKSRPLNARLFKKLCGSEHQQLLLHTDVRWLSRGKTLQRLFELREQVCDFLSEHLHPSAALLKDYNWLAHLAYLADVFSRLNDLNLELQGKDTSVLHLYDRVSSFMKKIDLWGRKCQDGDVSSFPQLNMYILNGGADKVGILQTVQTHVNKLSSEFKPYFPDIEVQNPELDWIWNPFAPTSIQTAPASLQERLIDLSSDRGLRLMFSETSLTQFWCNAEKEYPILENVLCMNCYPLGQPICVR